MAIILVVIDGYSINGYCGYYINDYQWLFYKWLLMVIILMAIVAIL